MLEIGIAEMVIRVRLPETALLGNFAHNLEALWILDYY